MKQRLDQYLFRNGFFNSRARAADAILNGHILVDGVVAAKASQMVRPEMIVEVSGQTHPYVSRGGLKLAKALEHFALTAKDKTCLDLGASTGGFTDVLLRDGAAQIFALDVGTGQLAPELVADNRVVNLSGVNARDLSAQDIPSNIQVIVCDVSFISLRLVLPPALATAASGSWLVALIKPQFEAGKGALGKNGVIKDPEIHQRVCDDFSDWFRGEAPDWAIKGIHDSPITGPKGNREFLFAAEYA